MRKWCVILALLFAFGINSTVYAMRDFRKGHPFYAAQQVRKKALREARTEKETQKKDEIEAEKARKKAPVYIIKIHTKDKETVEKIKELLKDIKGITIGVIISKSG